MKREAFASSLGTPHEALLWINTVTILEAPRQVVLAGPPSQDCIQQRSPTPHRTR